MAYFELIIQLVCWT